MPQAPVFRGAIGATFLVGPVKDNAEDQHGPADHSRRSQRVVHAAERENETKEHHWHCRDRQTQGEKGALSVDPPAKQAQRAGERDFHIGPKVEDHRTKRSNMHGDIDHLPLVLKTREVRQQDEMAR